MVIRATSQELVLSGTPAELRKIGKALARLKEGQSCKFVANTQADPAPYDRVLAAFEATASEGKVRISVSGDCLTCSGRPDYLACFASFFMFADSDPPGTHFHYEWWEGNEYIAPDSRPLVITVEYNKH